jgi:hypothetical protein
MAAPNTKEFLACFAFAYFMKNRNYKNNSQHKEDWIEIFHDFKIGDVQEEYKMYLEPNFKYSSLKTKYSYDKGSGDAHLYAIYNQMVSLFDSNLLDLNKNYRIYGQDSTFVKTVKDKCLERLKSVFSESFSAKAMGQDLTPADFYIVDTAKVENIRRVFNDAIVKPKEDTTILLNYQTDKSRTYENLILEYFKKKELFPISHKMPSGRDPTTSVKIGGNISKIGKISKKNIDPYSQLVIALHSKTPNEIEKLIQEVIEIKYDLWDISENKSSSTWKLIFDFNYKKIDSNFDDARFALEPLPAQGSGSFNGKFYIQKGQKTQTPWVAGMSPSSLAPFLKTYSGYNLIMSKLAKKRVEVFNALLFKGMNNSQMNQLKSMQEYKKCVSFLSQRDFHSFYELKKAVSPFFIKIGQIDGFEQFQKEIIKEIRSEGKFRTNLDQIQPNRLYEHYISLQMSYFLFVGGPAFRQFLKKAIFFTIFGAITKRGFTKVTNSGTTNLVKKKVNDSKMMKEIEVSFTAAPHLILL